jgi:hypothetical protein
VTIVVFLSRLGSSRPTQFMVFPILTIYREVRQVEGHDRDPTAAVIDSQVVKTTRVGGPERGYDEAKRLAGRKRHISGWWTSPAYRRRRAFTTWLSSWTPAPAGSSGGRWTPT